jgi:hypothetical protein
MKLIREHNDFDWINYGDDFITVNSDNIYDGMEVIINPESQFHEQAPYGWGVVQGEPNWFSGDLWVNVLFSGYGNQYRVGPNNFDLLIVKNKNMNESENDDFDWVDKSEYNPWDNYGYIEIDVEPKQENLELLINLALSTNYVSSKSKQQWAIHMEGIILDIMDYFKDEGRAYIRLEDYDLWYGYSLKPYGKWTKYSEIFGKNINESEEDDFGWIRDTNFDTDMFINKAFYFDPIAEEGDKDYTKLVNHLINLGFKSEYSTPTVLDYEAVGLYVYRDYNGGLKYVYTTPLDDDEDYELHIKDYARDNSEDRGENLELVDAREFIKLI